MRLQDVTEIVTKEDEKSLGLCGGTYLDDNIQKS